ncbi:MAG: VOC family protein [Pseudomonadota bacterium]
MFELDHLVISVASLDQGARAVEEALGVELSPGGHHPHMGTHNRLLSLGPEIYLEVIAIDPDAPKPDHPRWFSLDEFSGTPRLSNWACRTDDLNAVLQDAPGGMGTPRHLERGDFHWQFAIPPSGRLPFDDAVPGLLSWAETSPHPCQRLPDIGVRLERLEVTHPDADTLLTAFPALHTLNLVEISSGAEMCLTAHFATPNGPRNFSQIEP